MIILLLHLLRLLPVLCCGHRQLALENLALRHQLAVYKRTVTRPRLRKTDRLFRGRAGQSLGRVEPAPGDRDSRHRPAVAAAPFPRVLGPSFPAAPPAARASTTRLGPWSRAWPPQTFSGAPREFMVSFSSSVSTWRSEEHTSELQSPCNLVCRLLLEKKKDTGSLRPAMTNPSVLP